MKMVHFFMYSLELWKGLHVNERPLWKKMVAGFLYKWCLNGTVLLWKLQDILN